MNLSNYAENKLIDAVFRAQALGAPATMYHGLLTCTRGPRANSTVYAQNDTMCVAAADGKLHLYKCTNAGGGTSAASAPAYPGVANEAITDGTCTFTEQTSALDDGTALVAPTYSAYARVAETASLANRAGTQSAGSTTASTGTSGQTSNNGSITWPQKLDGSTEFCWGKAIYDSSSGGNAWVWAPLAVAKTINNGDAAPSIAAGADTFTFG